MLKFIKNFFFFQKQSFPSLKTLPFSSSLVLHPLPTSKGMANHQNIRMSPPETKHAIYQINTRRKR